MDSLESIGALLKEYGPLWVLVGWLIWSDERKTRAWMRMLLQIAPARCTRCTHSIENGIDK